MDKKERKFIPIITKGESTVVYIDDILYVEQDLRKVVVHAVQGNYAFYQKLEELMRWFPQPKFYRCHKSCLINFERVVSMKDSTILFETGEKKCLGRESYRHARKKFTEYITNDKS